MRRKHLLPRRFIGVLIVLALVPLACNAPTSGQPGVEQTPIAALPFLTLTAQAANPGGITPAVTETPNLGQPTATLQPGVTPSPTVCGYVASFVDDITIEDGTEMQPGAFFDKTWRMRNSGCLNWGEGTRLVFFEGDRMTDAGAALVSPTVVGATVDITVSLRAPNQPGEYTGYWQLQSPEGVRFGDHVYVDIVVVGPTTTPTSNVTPTAGNTTPTATVTATPAYRPFLGDWRRTNAAEGEISRVLIQEAGTNLNINMWTKCGTSECDYGVTAAPASQAEDAILEISWVKASYSEAQQLTVLVDGRLLVTGLINYTDPATQDRAYNYFFTKS